MSKTYTLEELEERTARWVAGGRRTEEAVAWARYKSRKRQGLSKEHISPKWTRMPFGRWVSPREQVPSPDELDYQRVHIYDGGELLELEGPKFQQETPAPKRGAIKGFSKHSRRRLLRQVAKFDRNAVGKPVFVTLTYGDTWPSGEEVKRDLDTILKRIRYKWPGSTVVWRLEYQKRGAPHFHFLIWRGPKMVRRKGANRELFAWFARAWEEVVGQELPAGTRVEAIRTARGAWYYLAKYLAKEDQERGLSEGFVGRYWGVRGPKPITRYTLRLRVQEWQALKKAVLNYVYGGRRQGRRPELKFFQGIAGFMPEEKGWELLEDTLAGTMGTGGGAHQWVPD